MYPRLVHIYGPLWIQTFGVMIALGFLVFVYLILQHPLRKQLVSKDLCLNIIFIGLVSAIAGGRFLYVITHLSEFKDNWIEIFLPWVGGLVVLGAILGVALTIPLCLYIHRIPILISLDVVALYTPLMQAIARLGCFFAGCCYGIPAPSGAWSITFTNPDAHAPLNIPLYPIQLYTSIASLAIFAILYFLIPHLRRYPGTLAFSFLMLENIARFTTDFWRGDRDPILYSLYNGAIEISQWQYQSVISFIFAATCFLWLLNKKRTQ